MRLDGLVRVYALARHNAALIAREPGPLAARIVAPIAMMVLLQPLYRAAVDIGQPGAGTVQAVTGMLVMFSLLAQALVSTAIMTERMWHTWDRLRATTARPFELMAGKALPLVGALLLQQAVVLVCGWAVLGLRVASPGLLALAVLAWITTLLSGGTAVATLVRSSGELMAVSDIGSLVLTGLGGALTPLAAMPLWVRAIAPISPGYWAMSAFRSAIQGDTTHTLTAVTVLLALAVLAAAIASWRISRGWGRSRLL